MQLKFPHTAECKDWKGSCRSVFQGQVLDPVCRRPSKRLLWMEASEE